MLKYKTYTLTKNTMLSNEILVAYINNFWNDIFTPIINSSEKHLMLMCKVEFTDKSLGYRTLGQLRKVNYSDQDLFIDYIIDRLGSLTDAYTTHPISKLVFTYIISEGLAPEDRKIIDGNTDNVLATHRFNNMALPISMNPLDYGEMRNKSEFEGYTRYTMYLNKKIYEIDVNDGGEINRVRILGPSDLNWMDTKINEGFMREIGKSTIYFINGEIVLRKLQLSAKPFRKTKTDRMFMSSFVTMVAPVSSKDLWKFKRIR